jgi:hypothetical protein
VSVGSTSFGELRERGAFDAPADVVAALVVVFARLGRSLFVLFLVGMELLRLLEPIFSG